MRLPVDVGNYLDGEYEPMCKDCDGMCNGFCDIIKDIVDGMDCACASFTSEGDL